MTDSQTEERFRYLFELIGDPVVEFEIVEDTPIVQTLNPAFEEVFGYDHDRMVGESLNEFIVPEESTDEAAHFDQRTATGKHNSGVVTRTTARGPREFLYRGVPYERDGKQFGFAIYTDITERNQRKRELQRQNERLEEFTRILSHDIRNPLNVAKLRIKMVEHDQSEIIEQNLDRIESIVDDVLALAWGGREIQGTDTVSLSVIVDRCWNHVETGQAQLRVEGDRRFEADPSRLQQLLENLFRNSIEHGHRDVTITVDLLNDSDGFYIADNGPGIAPDQRQTVFERGYSTTNHGTGLGLSIVQMVCQAHGWELDVTESRAGGARFEISGIECE